jgi:hypothetical protein
LGAWSCKNHWMKKNSSFFLTFFFPVFIFWLPALECLFHVRACWYAHNKNLHKTSRGVVELVSSLAY